MTVLSAVAADEKTNILNSIQIDSLNDTYSIVLNSDKALDVKRTNQSPDNMILSVALKYKDENPILLTSDNGLQIKAKGLQIPVISLKDFLKDNPNRFSKS